MPSNGKIHNNDTKHGALVSFSCNTGFKLHGSRQITCVDGRWNGSIPTCKGLNIALYTISFTEFYFNSLFWKSNCFYIILSICPVFKGYCKDPGPLRNGSVKYEPIIKERQLSDRFKVWIGWHRRSNSRRRLLKKACSPRFSKIFTLYTLKPFSKRARFCSWHSVIRNARCPTLGSHKLCLSQPNSQFLLLS